MKRLRKDANSTKRNGNAVRTQSESKTKNIIRRRQKRSTGGKMPKNCKCVPPFMCKMMLIFMFLLSLLTGYLAYTSWSFVTFVAFVLSFAGLVAVILVMERK